MRVGLGMGIVVVEVGRCFGFFFVFESISV